MSLVTLYAVAFLLQSKVPGGQDEPPPGLGTLAPQEPSLSCMHGVPTLYWQCALQSGRQCPWPVRVALYCQPQLQEQPLPSVQTA